MTNLITSARNFAKLAHHGHVRKYTGKPYFVHLEEVAMLVKDAGESEASVAAAYLHDTLEDTIVTEADLLFAFGPEVTALVVMLTDVSKRSDGNRATRKAMDRDHLSNASHAGKTIKLADLTSNTRSIAAHDPKFAKVYLAEKAALLEVLGNSNHRMFRLAMDTLLETRLFTLSN